MDRHAYGPWYIFSGGGGNKKGTKGVHGDITNVSCIIIERVCAPKIGDPFLAPQMCYIFYTFAGYYCVCCVTSYQGYYQDSSYTLLRNFHLLLLQNLCVHFFQP